jgi:hypothetical protein
MRMVRLRVSFRCFQGSCKLDARCLLECSAVCLLSDGTFLGAHFSSQSVSAVFYIAGHPTEVFAQCRTACLPGLLNLYTHMYLDELVAQVPIWVNAVSTYVRTVYNIFCVRFSTCAHMLADVPSRHCFFTSPHFTYVSICM